MKNLISKIVSEHKFRNPTFILNSSAIQDNINTFNKYLPGNFAYAVKTNPDKLVLDRIYQYGVRHYDVASLNEIKLISKYDDVTMYFMNPIKPRHSISYAYYVYGIRHFSLDSIDELNKICEVTNNAKDLHLFLRISTDDNTSKFKLSKKFGSSYRDSIAILKEMNIRGLETNISFHVGSFCLQPCEYYKAIKLAYNIQHEAGVKIKCLDVGGGFISGEYHDVERRYDLASTLEMVSDAIKEFFPGVAVLAEPGRAIVANAIHLIGRVDARKDKTLHVNVGIYNGLFDSREETNFMYLHEKLGKVDTHSKSKFCLYGPTCCNLDYMPGPYIFSNDIKEGDYIIFYDVGAYGQSIISDFNGLNDISFIELNWR